jgi:hypothetical protein
MTNRLRRVKRSAFYPLLAFLLLMALPRPADAACDASSDPVLISASCEDLVIGGTRTDVTIAAGSTVNVFGYGVIGDLDAVKIQQGATITGTFLNRGTVDSGFGDNGLVNLGTISTLRNEGIILSSDPDSSHAAIINQGEIGTLVNTGIIKATNGLRGAGAHAIGQAGHIGTLDNAGTISAQNSAIYFAPGISSRIDTLINSGTIEGGRAGDGTNTFASAIVLGNSNSIGTIINTGKIDHSVCDAGDTCYAAIDNNGGVIDTITNLGTLSSGNTGDSGYGIRNSITGTIGTLNNDQDGLKYYGKLPQNYLSIIYGPANYGKMSVTNAQDSTMAFGVDAAAPLGTSNYANVLSGISESNLAATSGSWGGGLFDNTWTLSSTAPASPSQWDLTLTSKAIVPSVEGQSGESLANAIIRQATEFASGSVPPGTIEPVLENGVTLQQAAQAMTTQQASQLSEVHAEGYSSNLTIGLQQIGMISEAVTDRMDTAAKRRIWIDGSAIRGTVDGYDGLSGFDYNLFHVVAGADLLRGGTGGLGVFGGIGQSAMSESEYVPQDFNTTSYFAGLYGGADLAADVRLSASAGYIRGENEATRHNADISQFTGGTATSDYASNGAFGTLKLSKDFTVSEQLTLSPFAGAAYGQIWADQAKETGGGDFNYTISDATAYTTVVFVGTGARMPLSGSMSVVGFARIGYDMFADDDDAHSVTANSKLFGSFEQTGADMGPVLGNMGLGLEGVAENGLSGRIGAVGAVNSNGYQFGLGGELQW